MNTLKRKIYFSIVNRRGIGNHLVRAVVIAGILMMGTAFAFTGTMYTRWHSEENQPAMCADDTVMTRIECSGGYCDNLRGKCVNPPREHGNYTYTAYKSEEEGYNYCPNGYYITGIDCHGSNCDNQSLQCTQMYGASHNNCQWIGSFSEEAPVNYGQCPGGKYAAGIYCSGKRCDNKYIYCCNM